MARLAGVPGIYAPELLCARHARYVDRVDPIRAVRWAPAGDAVRIIDQRRLPAEYVECDLRTIEEVRDAIATLAVRGAPAIGVAAAMGLVTSVLPFAKEGGELFRARLSAHAGILISARPTAVNIAWAMKRMLGRARKLIAAPPPDLLEALRREATAILEEDRAMCDAIGRHGLPFVPDGARVLTHCNAGALATAGIGTALAPVYAAHAAGRSVRVFANETRPLLQGSRLTAWELRRAGIDVTVLTDGMSASLMRASEIDVVLVGADRVASNGDTANKIGTYALAVSARHHDVPFYVCAPWSSIDHATPNGEAIVIEQRAPSEVRSVAGVLTAPADVDVRNPAFDITPAALITGVVTDKGLYRAPYSFTYELRSRD
jgi:methylthioribose-1-phosphate isomerase